MSDDHHQQSGPAETIVRWSPLVKPGARVLDVAAGGGRHALWFAERDAAVTAVDRDTTSLLARPHANIRAVEADLENAPWPFAGEQFDAVVIVNYLWRSLLPQLIDSVAPDGLLMYETFASGNEQFGRPRNPDFLLRRGELIEAIGSELIVLEYAHGPIGRPPRAVRQRLLAQRPRIR